MLRIYGNIQLRSWNSKSTVTDDLQGNLDIILWCRLVNCQAEFYHNLWFIKAVASMGSTSNGSNGAFTRELGNESTSSSLKSLQLFQYIAFNDLLITRVSSVPLPFVYQRPWFSERFRFYSIRTVLIQFINDHNSRFSIRNERLKVSNH